MGKWLKRLFGGAEKYPPPDQGTTEQTLSPSTENTVIFDLASVGEYDEELCHEPSALDRQQAQRITSVVTDHYYSATESLPPFPSLLLELVGMLKDPEIPLNRIIALVSRDPPVATHVVRVANSPFFRGAKECTSIRDAVIRLGPSEIAVVAAAQASQGLFGFNDRRQRAELLLRRHWQRALTVAHCSGKMMQYENRGSVEQGFLAGLFHDIGKAIALLIMCDGEGDDALEELPDSTISHVVETCHLDLGELAAERWNLPAFLRPICSAHHSIEVDDILLNVVRIVSGLNELRTNPWYRDGLKEEIRCSIKKVGLSDFDLRTLVTEIQETSAWVHDVHST